MRGEEDKVGKFYQIFIKIHSKLITNFSPSPNISPLLQTNLFHFETIVSSLNNLRAKLFFDESRRRKRSRLESSGPIPRLLALFQKRGIGLIYYPSPLNLGVLVDTRDGN